METENYEVILEPKFRIKFKDYLFKKDGKIKRNLKGNYKCEIKDCDAKAFIDRDGKFHLLPGFDKHKNHEATFCHECSMGNCYYGSYYTIDYYVMKKPLRIVVGTQLFAKENPSDNNLTGYYSCEEERCPVRAHIDREGKFRYIRGENCWSMIQHKNHKPPKYKNNYKYTHYDMKRFYTHAIPEPNCTILENPIRVLFRGEVYVKDGKLKDQYQGNYKCAIKDCPATIQIGYYANVRLYRYKQDHSKPLFHHHPKPKAEESPAKELLKLTLDTKRYPKSTLEKHNVELKKPKYIEKENLGPEANCECKNWTEKQKRGHKCDEYFRWHRFSKIWNDWHRETE